MILGFCRRYCFRLCLDWSPPRLIRFGNNAETWEGGGSNSIQTQSNKSYLNIYENYRFQFMKGPHSSLLRKTYRTTALISRDIRVNSVFLVEYTEYTLRDRVCS